MVTLPYHWHEIQFSDQQNYLATCIKLESKDTWEACITDMCRLFLTRIKKKKKLQGKG